MKKTLILLLLTAPMYGASWTVNTNAAQDARATRELTALNKATCASVGLGASCTQANARAAYCANTGAIPRNTVPCVLNGISSGTLVIYGTVGEYLDKYGVDANDKVLKRQQNAEDRETWTAWLATATQAQKGAVCTAAGKPAGCLP